MPPSKKTVSFAKAFEELEGITEWFEGDTVDLEQGLAKFERGLVLAKQCRESLKDAEQKIIELKKIYATDSSMGD